jgi:hypothetical protein
VRVGARVERATIAGSEDGRVPHVERLLIEELLIARVGTCIGCLAPNVGAVLVVDARLGERGALLRVGGVDPSLGGALIADRLRRPPREEAPARVFFAGQSESPGAQSQGNGRRSES